eukprot:snap_masked-scaffold_32-processed-gene-1.31-mRNA-1 protein AED:1.00 eAED:1.00 QI:0/0/0/0/1/1/2/0/88
MRRVQADIFEPFDENIQEVEQEYLTSMFVSMTLFLSKFNETTQSYYPIHEKVEKLCLCGSSGSAHAPASDCVVSFEDEFQMLLLYPSN